MRAGHLMILRALRFNVLPYQIHYRIGCFQGGF